VVEQLVEHLTLWSYSVAFPELAFIPVVRLRQFKKETKVDRFRRQVKQLIDQVLLIKIVWYWNLGHSLHAVRNIMDVLYLLLICSPIHFLLCGLIGLFKDV